MCLSLILLHVVIFSGQNTPPRFQYCAVCPPSHRADLNLTGCEISILSRVDVDEVTIATMLNVETISLTAMEPVSRVIDSSLLVDEGLEDKGIIISSDEELVITVVKTESETGVSRFTDAYQVYDSRLAGYDFFVLTKTNECNNTDYVKSFFSVMTFDDGNFVEIYNTEGIFTGASVINRYQVFTVKTDQYNDDFSGIWIRMSERALVVTGCMCAGNSLDGVTESYIATLQSTIFYGTDYVTPVIGGSIIAGYGLRVLASEADTVVINEGTEYNLNRGEWVELLFPITELAARLTCSEACLVMQWSDGNDIGNFMFNVFDFNFQFTKVATFMTLDFEGDKWVSIVVKGFPPMDDIFLDGESLFDETWKVSSIHIIP